MSIASKPDQTDIRLVVVVESSQRVSSKDGNYHGPDQIVDDSLVASLDAREDVDHTVYCFVLGSNNPACLTLTLDPSIFNRFWEGILHGCMDTLVQINSLSATS